jgi:hypothetical protein
MLCAGWCGCCSCLGSVVSFHDCFGVLLFFVFYVFFFFFFFFFFFSLSLTLELSATLGQHCGDSNGSGCARCSLQSAAVGFVCEFATAAWLNCNHRLSVFAYGTHYATAAKSAAALRRNQHANTDYDMVSAETSHQEGALVR